MDGERERGLGWGLFPLPPLLVALVAFELTRLPWGAAWNQARQGGEGPDFWV